MWSFSDGQTGQRWPLIRYGRLLVEAKQRSGQSTDSAAKNNVRRTSRPVPFPSPSQPRRDDSGGGLVAGGPCVTFDAARAERNFGWRHRRQSTG